MMEAQWANKADGRKVHERGRSSLPEAPRSKADGPKIYERGRSSIPERRPSEHKRAQSFESVVRTSLAKAKFGLARPTSVASFPLEQYHRSDRKTQRQTIRKYLARHASSIKNASPNTAAVNTSEDDQGVLLLQLAEEYQSQRTFKFNKFERLSILNILHMQNNLIRLDETIHYDKPGDEETFASIHYGIQTYVEALKAFQTLSSLKPSTFESSNLIARSLALQLNEPRYWDSPDALNFFDLSPSKSEQSIDGLRLWLQRLVPTGFLDSAGKERREIDEGAARLKKSGEPTKGDKDLEASMAGIFMRKKRPKTKGKGMLPRQDSHIFDNVGPNEAKKIIESYHRRPYSVSPVVDIAARLLVAIIGGLLVLVPMTILCYVTEFRWVLIVTFLFTISFSVALSVVSRASNDQIIMATAAYGAVLVVFVANILPKAQQAPVAS